MQLVSIQILMNYKINKKGDKVIENNLFVRNSCDFSLEQIQQKEYRAIHSNVKKSFMKDRICCEWIVPKGEIQTVFQTAGFKEIYAAGCISYDCGKKPFIIVKFFINHCQVGDEIKVFKDSSVAFNFTKFNKIMISSPENSISDYSCKCENDFQSDYKGKMCIQTRFLSVFSDPEELMIEKNKK
ncbi:S-Ena type endospore appendage [Calidifontibacillus erzurumensis]